MLTPAQYEQKRFWNIFEKKLSECGNPFTICYEINGAVKYFASVNKKSPRVGLGLTIDFLCRYKMVKINIYIENDVELFNCLLANKEKIESELGFSPKWIYSGERNPNTRRVISTSPVIIGNPLDYERVIEKVIPIIIQYKMVFEKYIPNLCDC